MRGMRRKNTEEALLAHARREKINRDVEEYLRRGGKIKVLPTGDLAQPETISDRQRRDFPK